MEIEDVSRARDAAEESRHLEQPLLATPTVHVCGQGAHPAAQAEHRGNLLRSLPFCYFFSPLQEQRPVVQTVRRQPDLESRKHE